MDNSFTTMYYSAYYNVVQIDIVTAIKKGTSQMIRKTIAAIIAAAMLLGTAAGCSGTSSGEKPIVNTTSDINQWATERLLKLKKLSLPAVVREVKRQ